MQRILDSVWIGDYHASQNIELLKTNKISHILAILSSTYTCPVPTVDVYQIQADDTAQTNLIQHFPKAIQFIQAVREAAVGGVLIHCQAGVSRSATIAAAYLIWSRGMTVEAALGQIREVRPSAEPTEAFRKQLDLFYESDNEWNPSRYPAQRHFLLAGQQQQILNGANPTVSLAYYPSPSPSQADPFANSPKPAPIPDSPTSAPPALDQVKPHKRLTPRNTHSDSPAGSAPSPAVETVQLGEQQHVSVHGSRIRCKMCRRELASREHILVHAPGAGQAAFAPGRRDMNAYRAELERKRLDQLDKEKREAAGLPALPSKPVQAAAQGDRVQPPTVPLAGLRISQPIGMRVGPGVGAGGARPPVGRPVVARPAVARPQPRAKVAAQAAGEPATATAAAESSSAPKTADSPAAVSPASASTPAAAAAAAPTPLHADPAAATTTGAEAVPLLPSHLCSSYFVEPLSWMAGIVESGALSGKIACPNDKCGAKLGNFDWAGGQCSCGAWVCPAFALNVSRVDEIVR